MGCGGGRRLVRDLLYLGEDFGERRRYKILKRELKRLYALGRIDKNTYRKLKYKVKYGNLDLDELEDFDVSEPLFKSKSIRALEKGEFGLEADDRVRVRELKSKIGQIDLARKESKKLLESMREKIKGLEEIQRKKEERAKKFVGIDDEKAKEYLLEKREIDLSKKRLEKRANLLESDLSRLENLKNNLELRIEELKAIKAREKISLLETEIEEKYLDD